MKFGNLSLLGTLLVFLAACGDPGGGTGGGATAGFGISLSSASLTAAPGGSATTLITVTPQNGFTGAVSLSLVNSSGATVSGITLSPASVNVTGSNSVNQDLTVSVGTGVAPNTYNLKVRATGGGKTQEANLTLTVQSGPSFTISLNPTSLTATQGESKTTQLTLTPQNGFSGEVTLSLVNPPVGVTVSPTSLTVGSSNLQQNLTIATTAATPVGQHTLTLKAASGSIQPTATLTLVVNQATVFNVNTTADTIDADPGNGTCADANGNCSLRAAVMEANALSAPVIINLPAGTYTLTRTSSVDEQSDDLDLNSNITLRGADRDTTILDGNNFTGLIEVYPGKTVVLENLTGQNSNTAVSNYRGTLTLRNMVLRNNGSGLDNGGSTTLTNVIVYRNRDVGIYNATVSRLTLTNVIVSENGGVGVRSGGWGGAILTLTNAIVSWNGGAGVENWGSTATLTNVTVSGNGGTGIYSFDFSFGGATLTLFNVTVSGNIGMGVDNTGTAILTNTTVSGNQGGGIHNSGTATLTNVTVSGNSTTDSYGGGGIYNSGTLNVAFSTITGNTAPRGGGLRADGTVKLKGVILAGNTATGGTGPECEGSLTSSGYNLIKSNADCSFTRDSTDILNQDPSLGALANNGGPVQTHLPNPGSPVLDKIPAANCVDLNGNAVAADARGVSRPQNGSCDIGAAEKN